MTSKEYIAAYPNRIQDLRDRLVKAIEGLSDEHFNQKQPDGWWSIGQIIEHMTIANAPYLSAMGDIAQTTPKAGGTDQVHHTWFAKFLLGAMDKPNTPAPKAMIPKPGPTPRSVVDTWLSQIDELMAIAKRSDGINLTEAKIRNPFIKLMKMNFADMFEVSAAHTERHVKQIEGLSSSFV